MYAKLILVGSLVAVVGGLAGTASGQWGCGCPYANWGYYPQSYLNGSPPYFALHPPVYYSHPVPRTYGYSPYPYPAYVLTPGSEPPQPVVIRNVYVGNSDEEAPEAQQATPPQRIDNPYFEQPNRPGVTKARATGRRQPQVIYPAALALNRR